MKFEGISLSDRADLGRRVEGFRLIMLTVNCASCPDWGTCIHADNF